MGKRLARIETFESKAVDRSPFLNCFSRTRSTCVNYNGYVVF